MIALLLFFTAGVVFGIIGLRLLTLWEQNRAAEPSPTSFRHHS